MVLFVGVLSLSINAQYSEFGGGIGATNTRTDIAGMRFPATRYGATVFYRYNFNEVWVLRADVRYARLMASDANNSYLLSIYRDYAFTHNVVDIGAHLEFNFLNFRANSKFKHEFTTFLTAGLANYTKFGSSFGASLSPLNVAIPFGMGWKWQLDKHWNIGMIYTASKTFDDYLDGLNNNNPANMPDLLKGWDKATMDWYHFLGFTVSYTLYRLKCPKYDEGMSAEKYWQRRFR